MCELVPPEHLVEGKGRVDDRRLTFFHQVVSLDFEGEVGYAEPEPDKDRGVVAPGEVCPSRGEVWTSAQEQGIDLGQGEDSCKGH